MWRWERVLDRACREHNGMEPHRERHLQAPHGDLESEACVEWCETMRPWPILWFAGSTHVFADTPDKLRPDAAPWGT